MGSGPSQPLKKKNSYSLDRIDYSVDSKIKLINVDITANQHPLARLDKRQASQSSQQEVLNAPIHRYKQQGIGEGRISSSVDVNAKKFNKLISKNDQLRNRLIQISRDLGEKLKKKKPTDIFKNQPKKQIKTSTALQKELQNAYKQIDIYKMKIQKYKQSVAGNPQTINARIQRVQNEINSMDIYIEEYKSKIIGYKNIHRNQGIAIDKNHQQLQSEDVYKEQIESLKKKLKQYKLRDRQRQDKLKFQQETMYQLEKKVSEAHGQYYPDLEKKRQKQRQNQKNSRVTEQQPEALPSKLEIQLIEQEAITLKMKHEDYKKKLHQLTKIKNELKQNRMYLQKQIKGRESLIDQLRSKRDLVYKVVKSYEEAQKIREEEQLSEFQSETQQVNDQPKNEDVFDISHLKQDLPKREDKKQTSLAISEAKSEVKQWKKKVTRILSKGEKMNGEKQFNDQGLFESNPNADILMVGMNLWLSKNKKIIAIQGVYLHNNEVKEGEKTSKNEQQYVVRYQLSQGDYIKSIVALFGKEGFLDYLMIRSSKNKLKKFGREPSEVQRLACGLSENQRPMVLSGASALEEDNWRINRLAVQVCLF